MTPASIPTGASCFTWKQQVFTKAGVELIEVSGSNDGTTTTYQYEVKSGALAGDTVLQLRATSGDSYRIVENVDFNIFICAPPEFAAEPNTLFTSSAQAVYEAGIKAWALEVNASSDVDRQLIVTSLVNYNPICGTHITATVDKNHSWFHFNANYQIVTLVA